MKNESDTNAYKDLRRRGWRYALRGMIFLATCLVIGALALYVELPFAEFLVQILIVAAWVALWRPIEIFLYDLPDIKHGFGSYE